MWLKNVCPFIGITEKKKKSPWYLRPSCSVTPFWSKRYVSLLGHLYQVRQFLCLSILNQSIVPCPVLTVTSWPAYRLLRTQVRCSGIPISNNFPQFVVIHTVKGFGVVNKAEVDVFLEFSCFLNDPVDVGNLISGSSAFSKSSLNIWKFTVHILLKPGLENFEHYFASLWDECNCAVELTVKKDVLLIIGDWDAKVGSQERPGGTGKCVLGVQNEAGQRLMGFCQENTLVMANTLFQQHKRWLYRWTSPDGQYQNQIDYILCSQRWRNSI